MFRKYKKRFGLCLFLRSSSVYIFVTRTFAFVHQVRRVAGGNDNDVNSEEDSEEEDEDDTEEGEGEGNENQDAYYKLGETSGSKLVDK